VTRADLIVNAFASKRLIGLFIRDAGSRCSLRALCGPAEQQ
jgi:hypothetical protein